MFFGDYTFTELPKLWFVVLLVKTLVCGPNGTPRVLESFFNQQIRQQASPARMLQSEIGSCPLLYPGTRGTAASPPVLL
eukprot:3311842-Rhodomonas_salina.1